MRKPGWYWVRHKSQRWMAVEYHVSRMWRTSSTIMNYYDDDFLEIGSRIPTPDEPWQLVPKYEPTEEMLFKAECEAKSKEVDMSSPTPTEHPDDGGGVAGAYYRGLLAAAPKPESQP